VCPSSGSSGSVRISYSSPSGGGGGDNSGAIVGGIIAVLVIGGGAGAAFFLMSRAKKRHPDMSTLEAMRTELGEMMSSTKKTAHENDKGGTNPTFAGNGGAPQPPLSTPAQPAAVVVEMPAAATPTIPDLKSWLDEHKLGHIEAKLREYGVSAVSDLKDLDESDLDSAGVKKGDKKKLTKALQK